MTRARMLRERTDRGTAESGFTLIELLITISILTLITGALGAAFMTAMRATTNNSETVHASNDAQLIAAFLVRDGQSAGGTNAATGLVDSTLGVSVNWIAENGGSDPDPAVCTEPSPGQLLIRFSWRDYVGSTTSHIHVAKYYYLPPSGSAAGEIVRVTCLDSSRESEQTLGTHVGTPQPLAACVPSSDCPGLPDLVELTVTEVANTLTPSAPYTYTLKASVRASNDVPPSLSTGNAASVPVLALGGTVCVSPGNTSAYGDGGSSTTKVYGGVAVDDGGANGCPAVDFFGNKYSYTAAGEPQVLNIPDPYASLTPPSQPCTRGVGSNPLPSGTVYPPGVYPQPLPVGATLAAGVFVLCNDVPTGLTGNGVLLYLEQGAAINWNNNSTTSLTAPDTGPYAGIGIWQDKSNTTPLVVNGGAQLTLGPTSSGLGSGIYAPTAPVELIGNADVSIGWVVAQAVVISGNHKVTIGVPPATLPAITAPATLPVGLVNQSYTSTQIKAVSGTGGGLEFAATGLPAGLNISTSGWISGSPQATCGPCTVVVTVTDNLGDVAQQAYPLTVHATPAISSVSVLRNGNTQVSQGAQNALVTITGTGFQTGAFVTISGAPDVAMTAPPTISATSITFNINVAATAATGARDITVTNPDTGAVTQTAALAVSAAPTITSVTLANGGGGAAGALNQGDTVTVVFSSQMSVASFCSTWSNDAGDQALPTNGSGHISVTVTDNGAASGNDSLTVGSDQCALNFGSVDLGSSSYVSATADFSGGNGSSAPTISWTASTKTLVIKLGVLKSGTVGSPVASSAPTFHASTAITDSWSGPLSNATFPLGNGRQF